MNRRFLLILPIFALAGFAFARSWTFGLGRAAALNSDDVGLLKSAARWSPNDPEIRMRLGTALLFDSEDSDPETAGWELETAVRLSPLDFRYRAAAAAALAQAGRFREAEAQLQAAVDLSPRSTDMRRRLGEIQLMTGNLDAALANLRPALAADPTFAPNTLDLVFAASDGNLEKTLSVLESLETRDVAALDFLVRHGRFDEADRYPGRRESLAADPKAVERLVADLVAAGRFDVAWRLWSDANFSRSERSRVAGVFDGDFSRPPETPVRGFDWFSQSHAGAAASLDEGPTTGSGGLRIDYGSSGGGEFVHARQLVLVVSGRRYRFSFLADSDELVSTSLPTVDLRCADGSDPFRVVLRIDGGTRPWKRYETEFVMPDSVHAVRLVVRRDDGGRAPAPIFGRVRLSAFALEPVE